MKILVLNCGSSSIKYQVFDMRDESVLAKGVVERIGIEGSFLDHKAEISGEKTKIEEDVPDHNTGVEKVIDILQDEEYGVLDSIDDIKAVGHRVAHGGEAFPKATIVGDEEFKEIKDLSRLAPLHNPHNAAGIKVVRELLPRVPQVAVFDTSFHQSMPEKAFVYPLPYEFYKELGIRRYGFHGTSHKYVAQLAAREMGRKMEDLKIITAHLGNGASITAIDQGKSVDTSMGFTPLEGLVMGTRCGDIDPAIVPFLQKNKGWDAERVENVLNKESGLLGISGVSNDSRDVEEAAEEGNHRAKIAVEIFCYRVKKYIGAYAAAMGGLDAIVFTAGIGENSDIVRKQALEGMEFLGIQVDPEKNKARRKLAEISSQDSKVKVFIVPTNEELVIARDTHELVNGSS